MVDFTFYELCQLKINEPPNILQIDDKEKKKNNGKKEKNAVTACAKYTEQWIVNIEHSKYNSFVIAYSDFAKDFSAR